MSFDFSSVKNKKRKTTTSGSQQKEEKEKSSSGFDFSSVKDKKRKTSAANDEERLEYLNIKEARDKKSALETELEGLKEQERAQYKKAGTVAAVSAGRKGSSAAVLDSLADSDIVAERKALEQEIDALGRDITLASRIQNKKYLTNTALNAKDFGEYNFEPVIPEKQKTITSHAQNIEREDSTAKYMSEDQRAIYNYYYNKFGEDSAEKYLDSIREDLNYQQAKAIYAGNEDKVLAQYLMGATAGMEQSKSGFQGALRMVMGDDSYQPVGTYDYLGQMAREDLADNGFKLPEWMGGSSIGQIGYDFISTYANMVPSIALGTLTGTGPIAFGLSAAGNAYTEKINEGYSREQATTYGVIIGVSEATLEKVVGSIGFGGKTLTSKAVGNLLPKIDNAATRIAAKYGASMLSEGVEEALQEYLEPLYRNIAFGETNELEITSDVIYAGMLGALMGGTVEGSPYAIGEIRNAANNSKINDRYGKSIGEIVTKGLSAPQDSEAYKLAREAKNKLNAGEELSEAELDGIVAAVKAEEGNIKPVSKENPVVIQERKTAPAKTETAAEKATEAPAVEELKSIAKEVAGGSILRANSGIYAFALDKKGIENIAKSFPYANENTAKQVSAMYNEADGLSADRFVKGVEEAYKYGSMSYPVKDMESDSVFAKELPSAKRLQAYYMGETNAKEANIAKAKEIQKKVLPGVKGRVIFEDDSAGKIKNSAQRSTIRFINSVLKNVSSIEYHIFSSYEQDGKRVYKNSKGQVVPAPNGYYNPRTHQIWIDLNAGSEGQGIMLYTLAHEHLHDIRVWSAEHYNKLLSITAEAFSKSGKDFKTAVDEKYASYKEKHSETTYDDAQEEVVAEAMSTLLRDENGLREFSEQIQKQDKSLWSKIKAWFADVIARITNAYKEVEPESEEAKILMEQKELFEHAQKVFAEAVVTAGEKYKAYSETFKDLVKSTEGDTDVYKDKNGAVVAVVEKGNENNIKYNIGEYRGSGKKILENWLDEHADKKTKDQILVSMDAAVDIVDALEKQIPVFKEWGEVGITFDDSGKPVLRCKVKNGEYEINFDFSTVCKKRKGLDAVLNNLIKSGKINLLDLSKSDIQFINETLDKHGFEIACGLCFVDSKRYRVGEWAHNAATMFNDLVNSLVKPEDLDKIGSFNFAKNEAMTVIEGDISTWDDSLLDFSTIDNILATESNAEGMGYKKAFARLIKANPKYRKFLTSSDIISSGGSNVMRNEASDLLAAVNAVGGTSKPKMSFSESIWDHSILLDNRITKEAAYAMGGARTQSFSDFVATMFFDYCQMFAEAQAKKLPMQAYTKELTFAKLFGLTGLRLNLSVLHGVDISAEDRAWLDSKYKKNPKTGELELNITGKKDKERLEKIKENAGLDAYGNYVYEKQSINFDESVKLQNTEGYSRYIGTIVVGISEKHIWKLLDDNRARMIIPYHKSGLSAVIAKARNIDCYTDFTKHQNTRFGKSWGEDAGKGINSAKLSSGTKSKLKEIAWDFYSVLHAYEKDWDTKTNSWKGGTGHADTITYEMDSNGISTFRNDPMRQTCEDYLAWCEEHDMIPQFEQFIKHPNYYKMQEDFDVYDCITGEYVPQGSVEFRLPENAGEVLLEELKLQQETSDRLNKEMSGIVDEIINERGRQIPPEINLGLKHQIRENINESFAEDWKKYKGKVFYENGEIYSYDFLTSLHDMTVLEMPPLSETKLDGKINQDHVVELGLKNASELGKKVDEGLFEIQNDYTGRYIQIGQHGLEHSLDANDIKRLRTNARLSIIGAAITKNAVPINGLTKKNRQAEGTYAMACLLNNGNGFTVAIVTVNEMKSKVEKIDFVDIVHSINGRQQKKTAGLPQGNLDTDIKSAPATAISKIKIADFLEIVNSTHRSILPNDVLEHFNEERPEKGYYSERVLFQDRLDVADRNRVTILENKNARLEKELKDLEKAYESVQNYARAEGILIGQVEQGKTMAKEMRRKQEDFNRKAKGYEAAIAKKKEQISAVRQKRDEIIAKVKTERAEAVAKVRKEAADRLELKIREEKARGRERLSAFKEKSEEQKRAIIEKYQTSIKKATEGRHNTDIRHKIKRVVNELNTLLTKQTKEKHVPLELQKPVAEALDMLNMDDQRYYESRIRGLEARIEQATSSEERHLLQEELNKVIDQRESFEDKIKGLKKAYAAIEKSADPYISVGYNANIAAMIERVSEDIGSTMLRDMNNTQLNEVYDLYKAVLKTVRDANKLFNEEKGASVVEAGRNVVSEIEASGKTIDQISRKKLEREKFFWNNLKPVYAFKKLGSKTLENLFGGILKGQGTWAKDVSEAKEFFERTGNKYGYKKWDRKKTFEFTSNTGKKFSLNLQQMMSLYAYSKREQAFKHLTDGGFVFDNKETVRKNGKEYVVNTAQAFNISAATLRQIIGKLSTDQRMFVDEMQKYLSKTMGAKGNEVSRAMYDIELFKEAESYFPLKSAKQFLYDRNEVTNETKQLVNSGFTKPIQPGANNPIILTGFMDVWANHVNDMSMYHAFVMPIEDFNKVYNFQFGRSEESDSKSVKSAIQDSFTEAATKYIEQLLKDINGGARVDSRESTYKRLVGNWKKAAVFASASVVVQQPSAIGRAFAEVNPIYFMAPTEIGVLKHKKQWEQLKKYAPVAVIKEMGYFDTDMGQSTAEFIKGEKTLKDRADDVFGFAPAKADEYTWCAIWDAVKRETKAKHKDLNVNSEEFLKIAGNRFTEIIDKTQVYDSVLSRSGNMRSKSIFMQMLTAFMAEPTTSANMVEQAFREAKAGHPKKAMAYINSVGASVIINSLLVSFIYALRDDDEDERFHEKYLEALLKELADGFNPLTYVPLVKDVWSIFQGWDVERVDMSLFKDLYDNLEKEVKKAKELAEGIIDGSLSEEEIKAGFKETGEYMFAVLDTIASMNGIPLKNLRRDFYTMPKNIIKIFKSQKELSYSEKYLWDILHEAALDQAPLGHIFFESKDNKLLDGMVSGDKLYLKRLEATYSTEEAYDNAIKAAIKDAFISKKISAEKAKKLLVKYHGESEIEAEIQITLYDVQSRGFEDVTFSNVKDYKEFCEPYGIPEDVYLEFCLETKDIKGDYDSNGESIRYSKTKKIMPYINELPLTAKQKTAIAKSFDWADSTIRDYKLW